MVARKQAARDALSPARIRGELALSRERMGRLLDVSAKTVERWETQDRLPTSARARSQLAQVQEMIELGLSVYTHDGFLRFLQTPFPTFRGRTALQLIEQEQTELVIAALAADYEGLGY